jgi:hypothetical protein
MLRQRAVRLQIHLPVPPRSVNASIEATWQHDGPHFLWLSFSLGAELVQIEIQT